MLKRVEHQRINALLTLCETAGCRRQTLLSYFGEACNPCGNCDRCLAPVETIDGTVIAQKALSAERRAEGVNRTRCAMRPIAGGVDITSGRGRPLETFGTFAGRVGTKNESLLQTETVVTTKAVAVPWEASRAGSVRKHRNRDVNGADQEAGGP